MRDVDMPMQVVLCGVGLQTLGVVAGKHFRFYYQLDLPPRKMSAALLLLLDLVLLRSFAGASPRPS